MQESRPAEGRSQTLNLGWEREEHFLNFNHLSPTNSIISPISLANACPLAATGYTTDMYGGISVVRTLSGPGADF